MSIKSATCKATRIKEGVLNPLETTNNAVFSEQCSTGKNLSIRKGGKPQNSSKFSGIVTIHILRNSVSGLHLSNKQHLMKWKIQDFEF